MKTYLCSYATDRFKNVRRELNRSALKFGIDNILLFDQDDLWKTDFYKNNQSLLDEICGAGYWVWKPYFILEAMKSLADGDILYYCDSGSRFVSSPATLTKLCANNASGMVLFDARPLTNRQFTKRDCFVSMECDEPGCWNANKVIATILIVKKSRSVLEFLNQWLTFCQNRALVSHDPNICGKENLEGFLGHRSDQAILSLLAYNWNVETYRNPTAWGNFLKPKIYRQWGEKISSPYEIPPEIKTYADIPQENSPYGTVFEINRLPNSVGKPDLLLSRPRVLFPRVRSLLRRYGRF